MEDAVPEITPAAVAPFDWTRAVHVGAWALIVLLAASWLQSSERRATNLLEFANTQAYDAAAKDWAADLDVARRTPPAPPPAILPQDAPALDALVAKAGKKALSPDEAGMLSAALAKASQPPAVAPAAPASLDPISARAFHRETDESAWRNYSAPVIRSIYVRLVLDAIADAALMLAVWRFRQALISALRWGRRAARTYRRYDQVLRMLAVSVALWGVTDIAAGILGPVTYPFERQNTAGDVFWFVLAAALWFGGPRLIRLPLRSGAIEALLEPDAATSEGLKRKVRTVRIVALTLAPMAGIHALVDVAQKDGGFFVIDLLLLALSPILWWGVPALMGWRLRREPGRRQLQAELAAAQARAEALAQENSQFV